MVMEAVAVRRLTLSEFLARPETEPASELIDGEVVQKPVPRIEHNFPVGNLYLRLFAHPATSAGIALTEQGLPYPGSEMGNLRVPDLVFFAAGREIPDEGYPSEPPDLAVEVRSRGQTLRSLQQKLAFLRQAGTVCTLLVDPQRKSVEVDDGQHHFTVLAEDEVVLESLGGFAFKVIDLFRRPRPPR